LDEEVGLYYYGARYYEPAIGKFYGIDPMGEKKLHIGGYVYCLGNPIIFVDTDGKFEVPIHGDITKTAMKLSGINKEFSAISRQSLIFGATKSADWLGVASDWHFDNRKNYTEVQKRWNTLNNDISKTISNIGGANKRLGGYDIDKLGNLIHNVQDFYSHSNYVELYIEYYQGANDGTLPTSVPIYDEGIKNADFNSLLKDELRTGDFHPLDNEKTNPNGKRANSPTSHNNMNKDNANTPAGKLAKQAAIEHTTKILKEVE
jgi:RHS repeat-associated protein